MKFNCLIPELRVFDIKKSKEFYTEVFGFRVEYEREDFAMMVLGDCQIMLQELTLPSRKGFKKTMNFNKPVKVESLQQILSDNILNEKATSILLLQKATNCVIM